MSHYGQSTDELIQPFLPSTPDGAPIEKLQLAAQVSGRDACVPLRTLLANPSALDTTRDDTTAMNGRRNETAADAYERGVADGKQAATQELAELRERYIESIGRLGELHQHLPDGLEVALVTLALQIAQQVMQSDDAGREKFTVRMVRRVLETMRPTQLLKLRMSPADVQQVAQKIPELLQASSNLQVVRDFTVKVGGVIAESDDGTLDATLDARIKQAHDDLMAMMPRHETQLEDSA